MSGTLARSWNTKVNGEKLFPGRKSESKVENSPLCAICQVSHHRSYCMLRINKVVERKTCVTFPWVRKREMYYQG